MIIWIAMEIFFIIFAFVSTSIRDSVVDSYLMFASIFVVFIVGIILCTKHKKSMLKFDYYKVFFDNKHPKRNLAIIIIADILLFAVGVVGAIESCVWFASCCFSISIMHIMSAIIVYKCGPIKPMKTSSKQQKDLPSIENEQNNVVSNITKDTSSINKKTDYTVESNFKSNNKIEYPNINDNHEYDSLEFDELMDMLDDDGCEEISNTDFSDDEHNLENDEFNGIF